MVFSHVTLQLSCRRCYSAAYIQLALRSMGDCCCTPCCLQECHSVNVLRLLVAGVDKREAFDKTLARIGLVPGSLVAYVKWVPLSCS